MKELHSREVRLLDTPRSHTHAITAWGIQCLSGRLFPEGQGFPTHGMSTQRLSSFLILHTAQTFGWPYFLVTPFQKVAKSPCLSHRHETTWLSHKGRIHYILYLVQRHTSATFAILCHPWHTINQFTWLLIASKILSKDLWIELFTRRHALYTCINPSVLCVYIRDNVLIYIQISYE